MPPDGHLALAARRDCAPRVHVQLARRMLAVSSLTLQELEPSVEDVDTGHRYARRDVSMDVEGASFPLERPEYAFEWWKLRLVYYAPSSSASVRGHAGGPQRS